MALRIGNPLTLGRPGLWPDPHPLDTPHPTFTPRRRPGEGERPPSDIAKNFLRKSGLPEAIGIFCPRLLVVRGWPKFLSANRVGVRVSAIPLIKDLRNSAGPVASAFESNAEPLSVIIGPTGGGKTESSVRRILRIARSQHPSPKDGIRKCRIVCVGNTYRDLWDKAIPSYLKVWAKDFGAWTGGKGDPATHTMDFVMYEGGVPYPLHIEVWFRAKAGDQSIEDFVRGLECTAWWFQEMDQLDEAIVSLAMNRVGRYPEPDDRWPPEHVERMGWAPAFIGVWGDTNMPAVDTWLYNWAFVWKKFGQGRFLQPPAINDNGGVNPNAENLHNLAKIPYDRARFSHYYHFLASTMGDYDVDRLLKLKKCFDRRGKPVHPKFDRTKHVASGLQYDPAQDLIISVDTGNTLKHAAQFSQRTRYGHVEVFYELSPRLVQRSIEEMCKELMAIVSLKFPKARRIVVVVDPSATAQMSVQGHSETKKVTYAQYIGILTGWDVELAATNDPGQRRSAQDELMKEGVYYDEQGCPDTIAALEGGFCFRRVGDAVSPEVIKNDYSHLGEASQYMALKMRGGLGLSAHSAANDSGVYDQQPQCAGY